MKFVGISKYLTSVLKVLWPILTSKNRELFEVLWEGIEVYVDSQLKYMDKPTRTAKKITMFNNGTRQILKDNNIKLSDNDINLLREVVHRYMSFKLNKEISSNII